jgi:hypothetical protein
MRLLAWNVGWMDEMIERVGVVGAPLVFRIAEQFTDVDIPVYLPKRAGIEQIDDLWRGKRHLLKQACLLFALGIRHLEFGDVCHGAEDLRERTAFHMERDDLGLEPALIPLRIV